MKRLRTALLGLGGVGREYLAAIRADDQFDLVAVSDAGPGAPLEDLSDASLRTFEDHRSLIVETAREGLDLLVMALEPFESVGFTALAADHRINVFHKVPFARNVREARRLIRQFADHDVRFVGCRCWQFEPAFAPLNSLDVLVGRVFAATASVAVIEGSDGWRGDRERAGGGVLLNDAYEAVDLLVHVLGLPQTVYAQCGMAADLRGACKYDAEDSAILTLRFGDQRVGSVTAIRGSTEPTWTVAFVGARGSVTVSPDAIQVTRSGEVGTAHHEAQTSRSAAPAISAFGASLLSGVQNIDATADRHLPTIATIEAAYLSAKTATPESPARLME